MTRVYYGWVVLAMAAAAMVGTLPGRTQGLGRTGQRRGKRGQAAEVTTAAEEIAPADG